VGGVHGFGFGKQLCCWPKAKSKRAIVKLGIYPAGNTYYHGTWQQLNDIASIAAAGNMYEIHNFFFFFFFFIALGGLCPAQFHCCLRPFSLISWALEFLFSFLCSRSIRSDITHPVIEKQPTIKRQ
jgi:hypothetical protein